MWRVGRLLTCLRNENGLGCLLPRSNGVTVIRVWGKNDGGCIVATALDMDMHQKPMCRGAMAWSVLKAL